MKTHSLLQGSPEWLAYRAQHFNASDAPAMMGCSTYKSRTQLLHEMHTGLTPEVDAATQRRFDDGHRFEALARPVAEAIIEEELYPVTGSSGKFSASFDGLTMSEEVAFEHKSLNADLIECFDDMETCAPKYRDGHQLPLQYRVQMEQQCMVSGCSHVLFMASRWSGDELVEERHCFYHPDLILRAGIVSGWVQFEADLAAYVPVESTPAAVATPTMGLPAVSIQVNGSIALIDNLGMFGDALTAFIAKINTKPETDQDFADLDGAAKTMKKAEDALEAAESGALAQTASIDTMRRTVAQYKELARQNRLLWEKLYKTEKDNRKAAIVLAVQSSFALHMAALNVRLGKPYMPNVAADFAGAVKGLKTIDSMRNAVDTELARVKIEANAIADKIQTNLATLVELGSDYKHLFFDTAQIALKAPDDLTALVKTRITEFKEAEEIRLTAEREKIRAEELTKIETARVAKEIADFARVEDERITQAAADAARMETPAVEVKPEPIKNTTAATEAPKTTNLLSNQVIAAIFGYVAPAELIAAIPVQISTTHADIIAILDTLSEPDLVRTLHFVQSRFTKVAA